MKNQLQQFHNSEFGSLEIIIIDGKPYFPATECAKALGYRNPHDAIAKHCKRDGLAKREGVTKTTNQHGFSTNQKVEKTYINEGNLYRLIIRSKLPAAVRFEEWVCDEILPSIRKFGIYATDDTVESMLRSPEFTEALLQSLAEERKKTIMLEDLTEELAPKALYCDIILRSKNVVPVSLIAKDYGMSAAAFNRLLHDLGVQYKIAKTWLLYQQDAGNGYTQTRTYPINESISAMHTCWTQKGRLFLYETLKSWWILPLIEKMAVMN
jgi:prophage antirepressor-like protein